MKAKTIKTFFSVIVALSLLVLIQSVMGFTLLCEENTTATYWYGNEHWFNCSTDTPASSISFGGQSMSSTGGDDTFWTITVNLSSLTGISAECDNTNITVTATNASGNTSTYYVDGISTYPCYHTNTSGVDVTLVDNETVEITFTGTKPTKVSTEIIQLTGLNGNVTGDILVDTNQGDVNVTLAYNYKNTTHVQLNYDCRLLDNKTIECFKTDVVSQESPLGFATAVTSVLVIGLGAGYALVNRRKK